jgi:ketosteroid isomerase-like protein
MSVPLTPPLARYFAATNDRDVEGVLAVFAARAVVRDEGQDHRGAVAIRAWVEETIRKYDFTVAPTGVAELDDGTTVVTGLVSGNFQASPVSLRHAFTLDGERITRLEIA